MKTFITIIFVLILSINVYSQGCNITNITANVTSIDTVNHTYTVSGEISFVNPPTTGFLTVVDQPSGLTTYFYLPWPFNPASYTISMIQSDCILHTITATYSDSISCTDSINYTAPCSCYANAGIDDILCGLQGWLNATVNSGEHNTHWLPQAGLTFSDINSQFTEITASTYGTYHVIWEVTNAAGTTCRDSVELLFSERPTPYFTVITPICVGSPCTVTYTGNCLPGSTFDWYFFGATVISGSGAGPYILTWNTAGNYNLNLMVSTPVNCLSANGFRTVQVVPAGTPNCCISPSPNAGFDNNVCGLTYQLQGSYPYAGNISTWSNISSPGTVTFSGTNPYHPIVTVTNAGAYTFRYTEVSGSCSAYDDVIIIFKKSKIEGTAQSSLVTDYSNFKAEIFPDTSFDNSSLNFGSLNSSGNFSLWTEPNQSYYLKISCTNPLLYSTIANTYYNSSYDWQNATLLTNTGNCDTINITVPLITYTPATGGQCRIYGLVRYDSSFAPVQNATIYLRYQPNQDPARFEFTNQNGYYSVNNIPNGNYKLFVDMPGLPQVTNHHIIVNQNDTVFANVNFIVDTVSISKQYGFGIYADTTGFISVAINDFPFIPITVFPNPFISYINLNGYLNRQENISVELINNTGQTIRNYPENSFNSGEFNFSLPIPVLSKGVYYLKITVGQTVYIKKLSKT